MTQHTPEAVADTAGRDTMDQAFDLIRAALTAARTAGRAEARFIHDNGLYFLSTAERVRHLAELGHEHYATKTADTVAQVAMWQALYQALADLAAQPSGRWEA